ncbi:TonB-dependent receptor plug domain-containing protein [Tunturiibacter empetritectus]|uniref:hypothetical protein n=1 Tax=Tunturiibacter empetritectus TaxID=3069691 RepID=UPI003D9AE77E
MVNVSEAAPILNTNDATLSGTFTTNTIQNFPLNGLDFSALTLYVPGSVSTVGTSGTTSIERSTQYTDSINLNGNRAQANNYTLEGIDLNETFNNLIAYSPAPESLQEIKVLTANSPADYGNVNGAGVVSILKSGTNQFHGSAYGYVQDYRLNANSWVNNHQSPPIRINPFSQSQFGGTFGGPIKRDKLFFFVDYLGSRYHQGGTSPASVFTQAMRNGDFSALLTGSNPIQLYDPLNGFAPYVGNKGVPIVNPVARYLFAHPELYPLPNATPTDGIVNNDYQERCGPSERTTREMSRSSTPRTMRIGSVRSTRSRLPMMELPRFCRSRFRMAASIRRSLAASAGFTSSRRRSSTPHASVSHASIGTRDCRWIRPACSATKETPL